MKRLLLALVISLLCVQINAQSARGGSDKDSLRSPLSVYGGAGIGLGKLMIGAGDLPNGYDELQFGQNVYADYQVKGGVLWNEKFGVAVIGGQFRNTRDKNQYVTYANSAIDGYKFLVEYSDLHYGYSYRYVTPQFVYRIGREPFNVTFNGGLGIGTIRSATGLAMYQRDASNDFLEMRYYSDPALNMNIAFGVEFAYMRQMSQHWFLNSGISLNYLGILQNYDINSTTQSNQQQFALQSPSHISGLLNQASVGVFVYFQWNKKESPRAYYE